MIVLEGLARRDRNMKLRIADLEAQEVTVVGSGTTVPATNAQNQMLISNATPAWSLLAAPSAQYQMLITGADPYTPTWALLHNHDHTGDAGDGAQISHDTALTGVSADDHHSETHVLATTGPHTGALPLTDLDSYAEGRMIIGGAASDWTVLAPPAAAGYALVSGATSFAWNQTPAWTGRHSFADGITFAGGAGVNSIVIPDALVDAFDITNGAEFLRLNTANDYFLIDPAGAGINVGIGIATPDQEHVYIYDATVAITEDFYGLRVLHTVTDATSATEADDVYGIYNLINMNDAGETIGNLRGIYALTILANGNVGDDVENLEGMRSEVQQTGGIVSNYLRAGYLYANLDGGEVSADVAGLRIAVDIEGAMTAIGGNVYGLKIWMDVDENPVGSVYGIYLDEADGWDYGIYQSGSAANRFGGNTSFAAGIAFAGASDANEITVPNNIAIALELLDADGLEYMRIVSTDTQPVVVFNEGGADVDHRWEAVGQPNALFVQGSDGHIGIMRIPGTPELDILGNTIRLTGNDNVELQIVSVGSNDADVELYCAQGTIGSETAVVNGDPIGSLNANAHNGTVYKRIADITMAVDGAFVDDIPGRIDFQVWDADGNRNYAMTLKSSGFLGLGTIVPAAHHDVYDATVDTATAYVGIRSHHIKTAGASGEEDDFYGLYSHAEMNDGDSTMGHVTGIQGIAKLTAGTIGDGQEDLRGGNFEVWQIGGTAADAVIGLQAKTNLDAGIVTGSAYGLYVNVDIESEMTSIGGNVCGVYILVDAEQDPVGTGYGLYIACATNIDYGIYQAGAVNNYLAGSLTLGDDLALGGNDITSVGTVDGVDVSDHDARHERAGADQIDGDHLDIDYTPTNYTPDTSPAEAASVDDLTAHLKGLDDWLGSEAYRQYAFTFDGKMSTAGTGWADMAGDFYYDDSKYPTSNATWRATLKIRTGGGPEAQIRLYDMTDPGIVATLVTTNAAYQHLSASVSLDDGHYYRILMREDTGGNYADALGSYLEW